MKPGANQIISETVLGSDLDAVQPPGKNLSFTHLPQPPSDALGLN